MATMDWRLRREDVRVVRGWRTRVERSWEEEEEVVDRAAALRRARLWVKSEVPRPAEDDTDIGAISASLFCFEPRRRSGDDVCARPRFEDERWYQVAVVALGVVVDRCRG